MSAHPMKKVVPTASVSLNCADFVDDNNASRLLDDTAY